MKINKLSASVAAGIIEAVKPYIATAEGRNFNFIFLAIVQTAAGYALRAFTLQPDHQSFFEYDLPQDAIDLENDAAISGACSVPRSLNSVPFSVALAPTM